MNKIQEKKEKKSPKICGEGREESRKESSSSSSNIRKRKGEGHQQKLSREKQRVRAVGEGGMKRRRLPPTYNNAGCRAEKTCKETICLVL